MKLGLIGYGYWGKILKNNIQKFTDDIIVHDPALDLRNQKEIMLCDKIFIATPANTHREIVDEYLSSGKDIFCEKPLAIKKTDVCALYSIADKNNCKLFVDWTFTFNDAVNAIKTKYELNTFGKIRSIRMNRLNSGPERKDVSAKWDLASHDISIIQYIFKEKPLSINWNSFKRNSNSYQDDTCIGLIKYNSCDCLIHASWEYSFKDRLCVFEFDGGVLVWNDITGKIEFNGKNIEYVKTKPPLLNSIETFLFGEYNQKELTINITDILMEGD